MNERGVVLPIVLALLTILSGFMFIHEMNAIRVRKAVDMFEMRMQLRILAGSAFNKLCHRIATGDLVLETSRGVWAGTNLPRVKGFTWSDVSYRRFSGDQWLLTLTIQGRAGPGKIKLTQTARVVVSEGKCIIRDVEEE